MSYAQCFKTNKSLVRAEQGFSWFPTFKAVSHSPKSGPGWVPPDSNQRAKSVSLPWKNYPIIQSTVGESVSHPHQSSQQRGNSHACQVGGTWVLGVMESKCIIVRISTGQPRNMCLGMLWIPRCLSLPLNTHSTHSVHTHRIVQFCC